MIQSLHSCIVHDIRCAQIMLNRIPFEITDSIIGHVGVLDHQTLRVCALVCRAWLPASRHRLFQKIQIDSEEVYRRFVSNVLHSEAVRQHLQATRLLTIDCGRWDDSSSTDDAVSPKRYPASRLFFLQASGHLPNVRHIYIHRATWDAPLPDPREPLLLQGFPSLVSLWLTDCSLPSVSFLRRILTSLPRLRWLSLNGVSFPPSLSQSRPERSLVLKLKCIRPPVAYNSMGQTGRSFKFKALETLRLIYVAEDVYLDPFLSWLAVEIRALEVEELSFGVSDVGSGPLPSSWSLRQSHLAVLHALASRVVNLTYDPSGLSLVPSSRRLIGSCSYVHAQAYSTFRSRASAGCVLSPSA